MKRLLLIAIISALTLTVAAAGALAQKTSGEESGPQQKQKTSTAVESQADKAGSPDKSDRARITEKEGATSRPGERKPDLRSVTRGPVRMSWFLDHSVSNSLGQELGSITDVVVGAGNEVKFVILSHGGVLGIGDKLIPIPWKAVKLDKKTNEVYLDINRQSLERAPNFDPDEWPSFTEAEWERQVFTYYAIPN